MRTSPPLEVATLDENTPAMAKALKVTRLKANGSNVRLNEATELCLRQAHVILESLQNAAALVPELRSIACCWWYIARWGACWLNIWWMANETIVQQQVPAKVTKSARKVTSRPPFWSVVVKVKPEMGPRDYR